VTPTGTTLTFVVGIGIIGTGDATVYANVQLTDLTLDDNRAVMNRSLVSFGGQHLFGLVHITGLTAGKEYAATLTYSARVNAAAVAGGPGAGQPFFLCLDKVTEAAAATIETAEASSSATFADLATAGPSATIDDRIRRRRGRDRRRFREPRADRNLEPGGSSCRARTRSRRRRLSGNRRAARRTCALQGGLILARLAAGSTTFKLQYASDGGSNTRYARWIAVFRAIYGGAIDHVRRSLSRVDGGDQGEHQHTARSRRRIV
jgi:hypothetical protein